MAAWDLDDGQIILRPGLVSAFLRLSDEEFDKVGSIRGCGDGVKSVARPVGPDESVRECGDG